MRAEAHQLGAGAIVWLFLADRERQAGPTTLQPIGAGLAACVLTKLPDLLEPATSPNHRQFFHSFLFASVLGAGLYKLHKWQPEESSDKFWKVAGMVALSAYLIHLALDATTTKSLPWIGKF